MQRGKVVRWGPRRGIGISGIGETMELRQTEASEEIFEEAGSSVDHVNAWSIILISGAPNDQTKWPGGMRGAVGSVMRPCVRRSRSRSRSKSRSEGKSRRSSRRK